MEETDRKSTKVLVKFTMSWYNCYCTKSIPIPIPRCCTSCIQHQKKEDCRSEQEEVSFRKQPSTKFRDLHSIRSQKDVHLVLAKHMWHLVELNHLKGKNFNPSCIKISEPVESEIKRLALKCLSPQPVHHAKVLLKRNWIKMGHLNVRSSLTMARNVMCSTETFLTTFYLQIILSVLQIESCHQKYYAMVES